MITKPCAADEGRNHMAHDQAEVTVLVIEDDAAIRDLLSVMLEDEGYTVATASNGADALLYLQTHPRPALIVLDLMMPTMDGWTFRKHQQANPALATIPVVVLSAVKQYEEEAAVLGAVGSLPKPFLLDELSAAIAKARAAS
jgi:CheY-like chemotaxis protein